jgi:hypothetical protein
MDDVMATLDIALDQFKPGSKWATTIDVDEGTIISNDGAIISRWYDADIEARYLGPERKA